MGQTSGPSTVAPGCSPWPPVSYEEGLSPVATTATLMSLPASKFSARRLARHNHSQTSRYVVCICQRKSITLLRMTAAGILSNTISWMHVRRTPSLSPGLGYGVEEEGRRRTSRRRSHHSVCTASPFELVLPSTPSSSRILTEVARGALLGDGVDLAETFER
jgi:hypothetical protein